MSSLPNTDIEAVTESIGGPNPVLGVRRKDLTDSLVSVVDQVARHPRVAASSLGRLAGAGVGILRGQSTMVPEAKDRRFIDEAWTQNPLYRALVQMYLATRIEVDSWIDNSQLSAVDRDRARFVLSLALDAAAPSNLPINPSAVKRFVDTGGASALHGLRHFVGDLRRGDLPSQVDTTSFEVGGNLATTPGAVVYRDDVLEVIQYRPQAAKVWVRPLVILPPQINRFYVFDLSPEKSLVAHALENEQQAFVVSWRNPAPEQRHWDLGTYLRSAVKALEAVSRITGSDDVNLVGACSGGITSVALTAYLAARDKHLINTLTLLVSVFDTGEDHSLLGIFASKDGAAAAKRRSRAAGVLDGEELGRMFALLRPNDLIWSYWVNNYLLGKRPPAFDVLFWNNDSTRLPAAFHGQLIDIYLENSLVQPGGVVVDGTPLDLADIDCGAFVVAGITDHITPWDACYRSALKLPGDVTFTVSGSGHIQSILNPPGNPKSVFYRNEAKPATAREWYAGAEQVGGSWWPLWMEWLADRSGAQKSAPRRLGNKEHVPLDAAPGLYVRS